MKKLLLIMCFLSFLNAYAVSASTATDTKPADTKPADTKTIDPKQQVDQKNIILVTPKSSTIVISLPSNPSTGYSWIMKKYDKSSLKLIKHEYIKPNTNLVGAAGHEEWAFSIDPSFLKKKENTELKFFYMRPWEKKYVKTQTYQIKVTTDAAK